MKDRNKRIGLPLLFLCLLLSRSLSAQLRPIPEGFASSQAATFVLAQRNFSDITGGTSDLRIGATSGIAITSNKLILADSSYLSPPNNNRILIYNDLQALKGRLPQSELPAADVVLGQPDFTSASAGTTSQLMNQPVGVATDGDRLYVADWGNNRVLIYNTIPETNGAAANVVVGQQNFTTSDFGTGPQRLRRPNSVWSDGARMMIADTLNNRILIYNRIPTQNGASADVVVGQPNFDSSQALPTAANTLSSPMSATTDGQRLIVTDLGNNRVLIYNSIPTQNGAAADVIVGQADFTSNAAGNTATTLNFPRYAYSDGTRLLIVDSGNNRILIYNRIPTQNGAAADVVLGQEDFLGLLESCAASNFAVPYAVASDGEMLFVSDGFNRRVLGFRPGPALVSPTGVLNAASFSKEPQTAACAVILLQPPLAPGAIASIFGTDLANTTRQADSLPLPTELGGVRVKFNGIEAPLFYASPTQINAQVPFELAGFSASMEVEKQTGSGRVVSAAVAVGLSNGAPGIFTENGTGEGPGIIVHPDFTPVTPDSPARKGETLIAFATGLGTVDHPVVSGAAAQFGASGTVTIGGTAGTGHTVTITINDLSHSYTTASGDTLDTVVQKLAELINNNDPNVSATADTVDFKVKLRARIFGDQGTSITYSASLTEGASLTADIEGSLQVPGSVAFQGIPEPGQTATITLSDSAYSYTTVPGDTAETVVNELTNLINNDPNILATADLANGIITLEVRDPSQALSIPYAASVSPQAKLTAIVESSSTVPGAIKIGGTVTAGQAVSVNLAGTLYAYTTTPEDTVESVLNAVAGLINNDPNVSATADLSNSKVSLELKNPDAGLTISFSVSVAAPLPFTVTTAYQRFVPGVAKAVNIVSAIIGRALSLVPGDITISGTPQPGQTVTISLLETPYSYTTVAEDTLQTVVSRLTDLINGDPNVSATADLTNLKISLQLRNPGLNQQITFSASLSPGATLIALTQSSQTTGAVTASVTFAGLVKGSVGLYQVNFTVPDTVQPDPRATLTFSQNLIVFGSVTQFDIFSNPVQFPIGE